MRDLLKLFNGIFNISDEEMSAELKLNEIQEQKQIPKVFKVFVTLIKKIDV